VNVTPLNPFTLPVTYGAQVSGGFALVNFINTAAPPGPGRFIDSDFNITVTDDR
jgi:hypothetical protein